MRKKILELTQWEQWELYLLVVRGYETWLGSREEDKDFTNEDVSYSRKMLRLKKKLAGCGN